MDDIVDLLDDAREQIAALKPMHDAALDDKAVRGRFRARVKSVLEHQRSALDYLAVFLTKEHGAATGLIYFPLAQSSTEFASEMERKMPGVAAAHPRIAAAIEAHQPYHERHIWLRELNQLTREQKHNQLSPQIVREVYQCRVTEWRTGAFVQWQGLRFLPGRIESQGGSVEMRPEPNRKPASSKLFELAGPTGILVFGTPLDPDTQRPFPNPDLNVQSGPLHQWCFTKPHKPVIDTLEEFQSGVVSTLRHIAEAEVGP